LSRCGDFGISSVLSQQQQHQQQQYQPQIRWKSTVPLESNNQTMSKTGSSGKLPVPDFTDAKAAYESKTNWELVRAYAVFQLCRIRFLVEHSESLLHYSRKIFGGTIQDALLKATLFGHFCAGEDEKRIQPVLSALQKSGIGSILDYAHEDDGSGSAHSSGSSAPLAVNDVFYEANPKVRMYDYEGEQQCDRHVETFKRCIRAVETLDADGYAAVKVTALGNPKLLDKMSRFVFFILLFSFCVNCMFSRI